jgi:predicted nucleic acid-binding protein
MNVIDSSAWLSYFAGDKNAAVFGKAIEDLENVLVPSITITEVFKNVLIDPLCHDSCPLS